jgi:hypothetical protein
MLDGDRAGAGQRTKHFAPHAGKAWHYTNTLNKSLEQSVAKPPDCRYSDSNDTRAWHREAESTYRRKFGLKQRAMAI